MTSEPNAARMEEIFPPVLQIMRGVMFWWLCSRMMLEIECNVVSILRGEGDIVAGVVLKSRAKPSAIKNCVGSSIHFLKLMMKPALRRVSMMMSRVMMALS